MNTQVTVTLLFVTSLTGCAVGPDYTPPEVATPVGWSQQPEPEFTPDRTAKKPDIWWESFNDPILTRYIERAAVENYDIRIALANVRKARALRKGAASRLFPSVGLGAGASIFRGSANAPGPNPALAEAGLGSLEDDLFQTSVDSSWEIDVFGGNRSRVASAQSAAEAAIEAQRGILLTVLAEVALNYVEIRGAQKRLALTEKNVRIQTDTLEFVRNRYRTGLDGELPVAQAEAQLEATQAAIPGLRASIRTTAFRLSVLTGSPPAELLDEILSAQPLPANVAAVPAGLPSELLRRRPDIRRAERWLAAATSAISVAEAEFFPKFSLAGTLGTAGASGSDIFDFASRTWSIGPSVSWPIFQAGRLRAGVEVANAKADAAFLRYEQAILLALEDVESSLTRYTEERAVRERLGQSVQSTQRSVELARVLYERGLTDFLSVLDAEGRLTAIEDRLVVSEIAAVTSLIRLYKSLGGGWQPFDTFAAVRRSAPHRSWAAFERGIHARH